MTLLTDTDQRCVQVLHDEAPWTTGDVVIFGKSVLQPRMFCYMADDVTQHYSYSGSQFPVNNWHEAVLPLKVRSCTWAACSALSLCAAASAECVYSTVTPARPPAGGG